MPRVEFDVMLIAECSITFSFVGPMRFLEKANRISLFQNIDSLSIFRLGDIVVGLLIRLVFFPLAMMTSKSYCTVRKYCQTIAFCLHSKIIILHYSAFKETVKPVMLGVQTTRTTRTSLLYMLH